MSNIQKQYCYRNEKFRRYKKVWGRKDSRDYNPKRYSFKKQNQAQRKRERKKINQKIKCSLWEAYVLSSVYWEVICPGGIDCFCSKDSPATMRWVYNYPANTWDSFIMSMDRKKINKWEYTWY